MGILVQALPTNHNFKKRINQMFLAQTIPVQKALGTYLKEPYIYCWNIVL